MILEARNMPKTCGYLLVRLQIEKHKLLGWAILAKLSDDDHASFGLGVRLNRHTVIETLREIQVLILDFSNLDKRYSLSLVPTESNPPDEQPTIGRTEPVQPEQSILQKRAMRFIERTRKYPKRLQWAAFDKTKFEAFLDNLRALNDDMMGFLEAFERSRHFQMQEATFMQILQVHNQLGLLFDLVHSLNNASKGVHENELSGHNGRLVRLARFKAINIQTETRDGGSNEGKIGTEINVTSLGRLVSNDGSGREARSCSMLKGTTPVWIEWRYYDTRCSTDSDDSMSENDDPDNDDSDDDPSGPPPFVAQRISRLAKLLGATEKPVEFLVPQCLGYVHDRDQSRFGLLFNNSMGEDLLPKTLFSIISTMHRPSLSARVRLMRMIATSIWYLHATNWLHKGLRSENVVFFPSGSGENVARELRSLDPVICGFDYSRPSSIGEETERPVENLLYDMYRHPEVQFDVPREGRSGFSKLHDIYSLGVVLYEIAVWKPVHVLLDIHDVSRIKASTAKGVRRELLEPRSREVLESEVGDVIAEAVMSCLGGKQYLMRDSDETYGPTHMLDHDTRLQFIFGEKVVKRIESAVV